MYLDCDCYIRRFPDFYGFEPHILFGSVEPRGQSALQSFHYLVKRYGSSMTTEDYYGSFIYIKNIAVPALLKELSNVHVRIKKYYYFDDMHKRLLSAMLSGHNYGVAGDVESTSVFHRHNHDADIVHMNFDFGYYKKQSIYQLFLKEICKFVDAYPNLQKYLMKDWIRGLARD